jgi:hypothetical protein
MGVEITVIDASDHVGWLASATRTGEIYMTNVATMVGNVLTAAGGSTIDRLNILDHGNTSGIYIGTDWISLATLSRFEPTLARLRPKFSGGGLVHLQHCNVGSNHALLRELSRVFGAAVVAGTGAHNPVYRFNFGHYERCETSGVCRSDVARP